MKRSLILLFVLFLQLAAAENITLTYPPLVNTQEAFNLTLHLINFTSDIYDVKFEMMNATKHIAKRFWENSWKSTNYWMNGALSATEQEKEFTLLISEAFEGNVEIITKIRHEKKVFIFKGNSITVQKNEKDVDAKTTFPVKNIQASWNNNEIINKNNFSITIENLPAQTTYDIRVWIASTDTIP